jgi:hypothetical protein
MTTFKTGRIDKAFRDPIQQLNGRGRAGMPVEGADGLGEGRASDEAVDFSCSTHLI